MLCNEINTEDAPMFSDRFSSKTSMMKIERDSTNDLPDEEFVPDYRAGLSPSEVVQSKLLTLMPDMPVPISCLHIVRDTRRASVVKV